MKFLFPTIALLMAVAPACVSKSKYKALEANLSSANKKNEQTSSELLELQKKIAAAHTDKNALKGTVDELRTALAQLSERRSESEKRVAEFKSMANRFKSLIDAGTLKVTIVDGRMVVQLATDVLFATGSANLSAQGKLALKEVAQTLSSIPEKTFQVEGHTDNVPMKTAKFSSNWELAFARAINVSETMIAAGLSPSRLSAASFGEYKPTKPNDDEEGKRANRRIEIVVVPDLSMLPGTEELNKISGTEKKAAISPEVKNQN